MLVCVGIYMMITKYTNAFVFSIFVGARRFLAPLKLFQGCVVVLALSQSFLIVARAK